MGLFVGLAVLGPALRRGYTLSYDMVFVPHPAITATTLGLDGSVPRAVPNDLVVALLSMLFPADLVQKALLMLFFVLGGWGIGRWLKTPWGSALAALALLWNPYVLERLVLGHWTYLLGLAILPWATRSAARARGGEPRALPALAGWLIAGALAGSTPGLLTLTSALLVVAWPGRGAVQGAGRRVLVTLAVGLAANAPWLVPALLHPGGIKADPAGVTAFAARSDTPLGVWGSLLTLGGVWNPATWPAERAVPVLAIATLLAVVTVLVIGGPRLLPREHGAGAAVAAGGFAALVLAAAGSTPGLHSPLAWIVVHVPGGGLLRDGQKWLAPAVLVVALCAGLTVERLWSLAAWRTVGVAVAIVPVLALPSLAWGVHGRLGAAEFPTEWLVVRDVVAEQSHGDVASFPWTLYRRFEWNDQRVVLDPLPRLLPSVVVVNDDLPLTGVTVAGEDPRALRIGAALAAGTSLAKALRANGVDVVVVHLGSAGAADIQARLSGARILHEGPELLVLDVGPVSTQAPRLPLVAAVGWLALVAVSGVTLAAWFRSRPDRHLLA